MDLQATDKKDKEKKEKMRKKRLVLILTSMLFQVHFSWLTKKTSEKDTRVKRTYIMYKLYKNAVVILI